MDNQEISFQVLTAIVPIVFIDEITTQNSIGFIYSHQIDNEKNIPFLVFNPSSLPDFSKMFVYLRLQTQDKNGRKVRKIEFSRDRATPYILPDTNFIALPIGGVLNQLVDSGEPAAYRSIPKGLLPSDKVADGLSSFDSFICFHYPVVDQESLEKYPFALSKSVISSTFYNNGSDYSLLDLPFDPGFIGSPVCFYSNGCYLDENHSAIMGIRLLFLGAIDASPINEPFSTLKKTSFFRGDKLIIKIESLAEKLLSNIQ